MAAPPPLVSPSTAYSGPPPPYSYPSSAASSVVGSNHGISGGQASGNLIDPPQTRQLSGDDKDSAHAPPRQSLPSIGEALSISSLINTTAPPRTSYTARSPTSPTAYRHYTDAASRAPVDSFPQPSPTEPRSYEAMNGTTTAPYSPRPLQGYVKSSSPVTNSFNSFPSSQPPRTIPSPLPYPRPTASIAQQRQIVSPVDNKHPPTRPDPTSNAPLGYQTYQPAYSYPPSTSAGAPYRTPTHQQSAWRTANSDLERAEEVRKATSKESPTNRPAYGESVKRHLDIFDLETSLNEVRSIIVFQFPHNKKQNHVLRGFSFFFPIDRRGQWPRLGILSPLWHPVTPNATIWAHPRLTAHLERMRRYDPATETRTGVRVADKRRDLQAAASVGRAKNI